MYSERQNYVKRVRIPKSESNFLFKFTNETEYYRKYYEKKQNKRKIFNINWGINMILFSTVLVRFSELSILA